MAAQQCAFVKATRATSARTEQVSKRIIMAMTVIYKICDSQSWSDAERAGIFAGAGIDLADGYIHFSTRDQVAETAAKHFVGRPNLLLIAVAADALGPALKWEPSRGGALFPHLYGPLPLTAVRFVKRLSLGPDRIPMLPDLSECDR